MGSVHSGHGSPATRSRWMTPRVITGLVLVVLAVVLVVENRQPVEVRVFVPLVTMPLWTALTVALVVGLIIGLLVTRPRK